LAGGERGEGAAFGERDGLAGGRDVGAGRTAELPWRFDIERHPRPNGRMTRNRRSD
jgi:hypothetical protein